jgi:hypothetical protein
VDGIDFCEVDTFPAFDAIDQGQLFALSLSNNTTSFTHGLHRFPAKFVPQVPAWALDNFATASSTILDPFMGSGTTLVEGLVRGGSTVGLDIDPLARFIARAKVTNAEEDRISVLGSEIVQKWTRPASKLRTPMSDVKNFEHWFSPSQWGWIQALHDILMEMECSEEERAFLLAVFSSTLRWASNADDQSQKTYVSGTHVKKPPAEREVFWRCFERAVDGLADLSRKRVSGATAAIPENGDATNIALVDESVDLAITSPPYLDSVDYPYNLMLEYFWLGPQIGIPTRRAFNALRRRPVGAKNPDLVPTLPVVLEDMVRLDLLPMARQKAAISYFSLMETHFGEVARCLKPGGRYAFVIGNSQSRVHPLPVHESLIQLAAGAGLHLERAFGYRIRRHYMKFPRAGRGGIILIDWVLVFQKRSGSFGHKPLPLPWVTLTPSAVAH